MRIKFAKQQTRKILAALALGVSLLSSSVTCLAIQANDVTARSAGVRVVDVADGVDIASGNPHNVIKWSSFNVDANQIVKFDANNYLNLINDNGPSRIFGKLWATVIFTSSIPTAYCLAIPAV